jgi:hypothetical protein
MTRQMADPPKMTWSDEHRAVVTAFAMGGGPS